MFPHPHTIAVLKEMEHRQRLAEAAADRRAGEARPIAGAHRSVARAARTSVMWPIGEALIAVGTRLQGTERRAPGAPLASPLAAR